MNYFPEPYTHSKNKIKVELDLSNYITKSDLETQQVLIHQILPRKSDLASLKSEIDKLDDLSKVSDVVKNGVVKKTVFDELLKKVNANQTTNTSHLA